MCSEINNSLKPRKIFTCSSLFDTLVMLKFLKIQCHEEIINKFNEMFKQRIFSISLDHTINRAMICTQCLRAFLCLVGSDCSHENISFVNQDLSKTTVELYCKKFPRKSVSGYRNYLPSVFFW